MLLLPSSEKFRKACSVLSKWLRSLSSLLFSGLFSFQSTETWLCATASASSSLVTGLSQNTLQTVSYLPQLLLWLISNLLTVYVPSRQLCSSAGTQMLCISYVRTKTFGRCCFSNGAPKQWNSFPSDMCHIQSSNPCLQHCFKNSSLQIVPQAILNSVFLLASPTPSTNFPHPHR